MAAKALPDFDTLHKLLRYDAESGLLYWKVRPMCFSPSPALNITWNKKYAGKPAGKKMTIGYLGIGILGREYSAHRVVWAMHHETMPEEVDHINGDRSDNRLANLRGVTKAVNAKNKRMSRRNVSGVTGVYLHKPTGLWKSEIQSDGIRECLGFFRSLEDAAASRKAAEIRLGFHANHGDAHGNQGRKLDAVQPR